MSTPSLAEVLRAWRKVTTATDGFLDSLTTEDLLKDLPLNGRRTGQSLGSAIGRLTYHYWFHIGEIQAIRQILGRNAHLPVYVGKIEEKAPYRPEEASAPSRASATDHRLPARPLSSRVCSRFSPTG